MKILWSNEVWEWYRNNNIQNYIDSEGAYYNKPVLPKFTNRDILEFNTQGNTPEQDIIVENFLLGIPEWNECLVVLTLLGVWPSNEDWPRFYNWRGRNGSKFSVYDAPGHLFYNEDIKELKELLTQVFECGWEGYMLLKSKESSVDIIIFISHDGWLEVNSNTNFTIVKKTT
jgi:hypothetical protein